GGTIGFTHAAAARCRYEGLTFDGTNVCKATFFLNNGSVDNTFAYCAFINAKGTASNDGGGTGIATNFDLRRGCQRNTFLFCDFLDADQDDAGSPTTRFAAQLYIEDTGYTGVSDQILDNKFIGCRFGRS